MTVAVLDLRTVREDDDRGLTALLVLRHSLRNKGEELSLGGRRTDATYV